MPQGPLSQPQQTLLLLLLLLLILAPSIATATAATTTIRPSSSRRFVGFCLLQQQLQRPPRLAQPLLYSSSNSSSMGRKPASASTAAAAVTKQEEGGGWIDLRVPPNELRPEFSLNMGQCFNWKRRLPAAAAAAATGGDVKVEEPGALVPAASEAAGGDDEEEEKEWVGVLGRRVLCVKQTPHSTLVRQLHPPPQEGGGSDSGLVDELRDYFQVKEPLAPLYRRWAAGDDRMRQVAERIPGVRVVKQDPTECLFSFICSSNNNIPRITLMLDRLRSTYGEPLGEGYHAFPSIDALAAAPEQALRDLGLGYRANFIRETAQKLQGLGKEGWLLGLRAKERRDVQEALIDLPGVGRKVADCVALFSLDQQGAIPVDVHVWRIACRDYDPSLKDSKSLTPTIYERVGDLFRDRYGPHAGWAHSLLFAAELPNYRKRLPSALQAEMEAFKKEESEDKAAKRAEKRERQAQAQEGRGDGGEGEKKEVKKRPATGSGAGKGKGKGAKATAASAIAVGGDAAGKGKGKEKGAGAKAGNKGTKKAKS